MFWLLNGMESAMIAATDGEAASKGIAKERVLAVGFARPINRGQECCVRDIVD